MWRLVVIAASFMAAAALATTAAPRSAYACTPPGPDFDGYASSSMILEGRIRGWTEWGDDDEAGIVPIQLDMDIQRIWKGEGDRSITIVAYDTLRRFRDEFMWGPGGLCGVFHEDPTGSYIIMGMRELEDGILQPGAFSVYFQGAGPEGEEYQAAVAYLTSRQSDITLPSTGAPPEAGASSHHLAAAAAAALGLALLGVSLALRRSRV